MDYSVKDSSGAQIGPVNEDALLTLVAEDRINAASPMKKAMMPAWKTAADFSFLKEALEAQEARLAALEAEKAAAEGKNAKKDTKKDADRTKTEAKKKPSVPAIASDKSAFENEYIPETKVVFLRVKAFLFDLISPVLCAMLLLLLGTLIAYAVGYFQTVTSKSDSYVAETIKSRDDAWKAYEEAKEKAIEEAQKASTKDNVVEPVLPDPPPVGEVVRIAEKTRVPSIVDDKIAGFRVGTLWQNIADEESYNEYVCIMSMERHSLWVKFDVLQRLVTFLTIIYALFLFFYITIPITFYSQTAGMWYYGLFVSDAEDPRKDITAWQAYLFQIISFFTFFLTPFFVLGGFRALNELLTKTRVIRVAARKN